MKNIYAEKYNSTWKKKYVFTQDVELYVEKR